MRERDESSATKVFSSELTSVYEIVMLISAEAGTEGLSE